MTQLDNYQKETIRQLLNENWEQDNRSTWGDGTSPKTKRIFFVSRKYDLSEEFPVPTIKPVALKTCFREIDWIYRKKSNNVNDFNGKIWDSWADKEGSIGKAYGYQIAKPTYGYSSQIDYVLEEGKKNPSSRRLVIEMLNPEEAHEMSLLPCAHHLQFLRKDGKTHLLLKQRSQDFLVANDFNVFEYALLLTMVARHWGDEPGILYHVIGDCHLYDRHEEVAIELLEREPKKTPTLWVNPDVTDFYEFTEDDFKLIDYEPHPRIKKLEVSI